MKSKYKTNEYQGGNEVIDRLIAEHWPGEKVWMVNGPEGRRPVVADSKKEAEEIYAERCKNGKYVLVPPAPDLHSAG